jgi:hypothetical protein
MHSNNLQEEPLGKSEPTLKALTRLPAGEQESAPQSVFSQCQWAVRLR